MIDRAEIWTDLDGSIWVVWSQVEDIPGRTLPRSLRLDRG